MLENICAELEAAALSKVVALSTVATMPKVFQPVLLLAQASKSTASNDEHQYMAEKSV